MKFLITGRTGCGKDTIRKCLERSYGWTFVTSYATRPMRYKGEDTHLFITKEQAAAIPQEERAAQTVVNGYEYFATRQQVETADAYIIDPVGVRDILTNMPECGFYIIHMTADADKQAKAAISRAENPEAEKEVFKKRTADEAAEFDAFEYAIYSGEVIKAPNVLACRVVDNDYREETIWSLAKWLQKEKESAALRASGY